MPVHASSVIATSIQTWDSTLYVSLTDRENYCYTTANINIVTGQEVITYQPQFQALSDAIVAYTTVNRNGLVTDLFSISVGYKMLNAMYNTDYTQAANLPASARFSMDGQITAINASAISAYADYNGTIFTALPALTTAITSADTNESNMITSTIQPAMTSTVKALSVKLLVEDIATTGSITKTEIGNWWYGSVTGELGYKALNAKYNFGLTPPAYVP